MAVTEKRIKQVVEVRDRLSKAVSELEWAYRGLYYGSEDAPSFDSARDRAERAARSLLDLIPALTKDVGESVREERDPDRCPGCGHRTCTCSPEARRRRDLETLGTTSRPGACPT